jgi:hypothetical protein
MWTAAGVDGAVAVTWSLAMQEPTIGLLLDGEAQPGLAHRP